MRGVRLAALVGFLAAILMATAPTEAMKPLPQTTGPGIPPPAQVTLDPSTTAVLVLDLSTRCNDPQQVCREIVSAVRRVLDGARARGVLVAYTVSAAARGTALGDVWEGFDRRPDEPVLYPDAFDKFAGGELQGVLAPRGITTLVLAGSSTNVSVLYTGTTAARQYGYDVVIPIDGVNTDTPYQQEYSLYQFTVLPNVASKFRFTTVDLLSFAAG
jgi:nicotinamidase-related amidase